MEPAITDMLLQHVQAISYNFGLQHLNSYQNIDQLIDLEMQRLKAQGINDEEQYVAQMLLEQPVVVDRRQQPRPSSSSDDNTAGRDNTAQQRAESCRKSRINNKIKMAKTKFRHKYMANKLAQSTAGLNCLKNLIAQTEAKLLLSGYDQSMLQNLRNTFGVDKS